MATETKPRKLRYVLARDCMPGARKQGDGGNCRPPSKMLKPYFPPPEQSIFQVPREFTVLSMFQFLKGYHAEMEDAISQSGIPRERVLDSLRGMVRKVISECENSRPEDVLSLVPPMLEAAKYFSFRQEKKDAAILICKAHLALFEPMAAGKIAARELTREEMREFIRRRISDWDSLPVPRSFGNKPGSE
jgi:hypothetical protein